MVLRSTTTTRDTIPRARVYEWFIQDRATSDTGDRLFPSYRRIICSDDVVLWDGPNPSGTAVSRSTGSTGWSTRSISGVTANRPPTQDAAGLSTS